MLQAEIAKFEALEPALTFIMKQALKIWRNK